jgi:3-methyladenine DNA glycosylase/8-oxoguanine DNA glycosylase
VPKAKLAPPEAHLIKVCAGMARVVRGHDPFPATPPRPSGPYEALFRAIIFQQLSGKAAETIYHRVIALFPRHDFPTPLAIRRAPEEKLRSAGLSR